MKGFSRECCICVFLNMLVGLIRWILIFGIRLKLLVNGFVDFCVCFSGDEYSVVIGCLFDVMCVVVVVVIF